MRVAAAAALALAAAGASAQPAPKAGTTTPLAERVAVLGVLDKRSGRARELTLKPGEAAAADALTVRLSTCETTPPWERPRESGAFVQVDERLRRGSARRFSGWLFAVSPSLHPFQHPRYDVWLKSCAMTHATAGPETVTASTRPERAERKRPRRRAARAAEAEPAAETPEE